MRHLLLARLVRHVVEIALGVGRLVVDRRRDDARLDRHRRDGGFQAAGGAEEVAGHRLRRADGDLVGVLAEHALDGDRLGLVADRASTCRAR